MWGAGAQASSLTEVYAYEQRLKEHFQKCSEMPYTKPYNKQTLEFGLKVSLQCAVSYCNWVKSYQT